MADLDALFGSSDSEEGGEEPQQRAETQQRQKDDLEDSDDEQPKARQQQAARQLARSGSGDDEEEDGAAGKRRDANAGNPQGGAAEAPMVLHPVPDNTSVCLIRTTNVIAFQPRPFDPATFEVEEDTCLDATGKYRVPRPVEAVVRWRVRRLPDGSEARESNARFVRWEDGTLTLMLGSEVLDLPERDISESNQYVFTVTGAGAPFQGQAPLTRRLDMRPVSLDSGLHRKVQETVGRRHDRTQRVVRHGGLDNPELVKKRAEEQIEERIRSKTMLQRKQERVMARAYGGAGRRSRPSRLSEGYLEEEQDWEDEEGGGSGYDYDDGLSADQRARMALARNRAGLSEEAEAEAARRLQAAKRGGLPTAAGTAGKRRRIASDDEEEEELGEEEEYVDSEEDGSGGDDDDEPRKKSKLAKQGSRGGADGGEETGGEQSQGGRAKAKRGVILSESDDD